jgi:hypothetical protein
MRAGTYRDNVTPFPRRRYPNPADAHPVTRTNELRAAPTDGAWSGEPATRAKRLERLKGNIISEVMDTLDGLDKGRLPIEFAKAHLADLIKISFSAT